MTEEQGSYKGATTCAICGEKLVKARGWPFPPRLGGWQIPYCNKCMERIYRYNSSIVGYKVGLWLTCAQFCMPYKPELLPDMESYKDKGKVFLAYLDVLKEKGADKGRNGAMTFRDGISDIRRAFSGEFATLEVDDEMLNDAEYKEGKVSQERDWGFGPPERPYTQEDYDALDRFYEALTENRVNVTKQIEIAIRQICVMKLEQQYCIFQRDFAKAKQLEDIIKAEMEGEQLRKKDELPQDRVRLDDIVLACERAGLIGKSYDELVEILATKMFHTKYGYTRDAADQMLLYIANATRTNEGFAEFDRLPDDLAIVDHLGEFAEEPDEAEKKLYKELQISPLHMGDKK